jgi:hypothetical protein
MSAIALSCALLTAAPATAGNLIYHGGPVIVSAKVVFIFWGPSFSNPLSPDFPYAQSLQAFRNQLGTSIDWNVLTQYSGIQLTNLGAGTADWFDTSAPAAAVTDTKARTEINTYLASHTFDNSAIYEVVLPSTSYSSNGSSSSCGGPSLAYCSYHDDYTHNSSTVKYSVQPYPSCGGCQVSGWTPTQNQEHFVCFETRDIVTDPTFAGWFDSNGLEIDEKCSGTATVCGKAWSNLAHGCV